MTNVAQKDRERQMNNHVTMVKTFQEILNISQNENGKKIEVSRKLIRKIKERKELFKKFKDY